ncbi:hypothetical protein RCOM_1504560 [Ricinus communis]|uniref:Uncharacterized protein n=1 Tax=Ricinus communis TaxID=3988 RepID=B9RA88_RICCO|nr:hypothetical protein RCOM_1504560 [Ricinus communis]
MEGDIVVDKGVYGIEGQVCRLPEIAAICKIYKAYFIWTKLTALELLEKQEEELIQYLEYTSLLIYVQHVYHLQGAQKLARICGNNFFRYSIEPSLETGDSKETADRANVRLSQIALQRKLV